jgi:hypothetical protein
MPRTEQALILLLRIGGVVTLSALGAVVMPYAWMDAIHRSLGLGDLPDAPIVGYLTRSLSGMYAMHGALLLLLSGDVRRYLPAIRLMSLLCIAFGAGTLVLDIYVGLPPIWTASEGPSVVVLGSVLAWLAWHVSAATRA